LKKFDWEIILIQQVLSLVNLSSMKLKVKEDLYGVDIRSDVRKQIS